MNNITYVALPNDLLVRLVKRYGMSYDGIIEYAVEDFLDRTADEFMETGTLAWSDDHKGYTWDRLFLPEGTQLRTTHHGQHKIAEVRNGQIVYDDKVYRSPGKACNAMRGDTSNNAWLTLEIKRPQDAGYRIANHFRRN